MPVGGLKLPSFLFGHAFEQSLEIKVCNARPSQQVIHHAPDSAGLRKPLRAPSVNAPAIWVAGVSSIRHVTPDCTRPPLRGICAIAESRKPPALTSQGVSFAAASAIADAGNSGVRDNPRMTDSGSSDDDFREYWVSELQEARSGQAARLPATVQAALRAWGRFSVGATLLLAEARRKTASAARSAEAVVRDVAPVVGRVLVAATQVAAVTYAEHLNERYRQSDQALRRRGWWALSSWSDTELEDFAGLARVLGRRDFDHEICRRYRAYDGRRLRRVVRGWSDEPAFKLRRPIIRDALADHLARRYRVSVPTLLPCIEGVAADTFGMARSVRVPEGVESLSDFLDGLDALALDVALDSLGSLYGPVDFGEASPLSPRLNRHLILHGRVVRYGNEANSLKMFMYLDELHSQVSAKRRLEEGRVVPLEQRPIRLANDLVKALGVPDDVIAAARRMQPLLESRIDATHRRLSD
jgi:hypothetical protein